MRCRKIDFFLRLLLYIFTLLRIGYIYSSYLIFKQGLIKTSVFCNYYEEI